MSPKSLLRAKEARSDLSEMAEGTKFTRMYPEAGDAVENAENVKKLIFCSGKIYYEILKVKYGIYATLETTRILFVTSFALYLQMGKNLAAFIMFYCCSSVR